MRAPATPPPVVPPAAPLRTWPTLRKLLLRFRPRAGATAGVFALYILRIALELSVPLVVQAAIEELSAGPGGGALPRGFTDLLLLLAALLAARVVVLYVATVAAASLAQDLENVLRAELFERVTRLRFRWHDRNRSGKTIARSLRDMERSRHFFREVAFGYLECVILLALGVLAAALVHWSYGLAIGLGSGIGTLLTLRAGSEVARRDLEADEHYDHVTTVLQENVAGARVVRAFGREPAESSKFGGRLRSFTGAWHSLTRFWTSVLPWVGTLHNLGLASAVVLCAVRVGSGEGTVAEGAAVILIVRALVHRLRNLTRLVILGQQAVASAARVFEVLEHEDVLAVPAEPRRLPAKGGHLRIEGVSFGYTPGVPVLRDVTLEVPAGGSLGVLGPTGAGKTTLVQLLPRFYDPEAGRILLDGIDVRDLDPAELTAAVGIVFQEAFLFSATVAENIAYGRPGVTPERIVACSKLAAAHEFVERLPQGYETRVGERGVSLSGGQRQRLTIARALALDPRVLVFDDATSAVDALTEKELFRGIRAAAEGRTTLVISQRITSLRWCDRIAVLDRGAVTAVGTHAELLATSPLYAEVHEHQRLQGSLR
jgi:ATP-binding cassette subfamily B protein